MIECPLPSYFPKSTDDAPILIKFLGNVIGAPFGYRGFNYAIADQGLSVYPEYLGQGGEYAYGNSWIAVGNVGEPTTPLDVEDEFYYWYEPIEGASISLYARGVIGTSGLQAIEFDYIAAYINAPITTDLKVNKSRRRGRFL